MSAKTVYHSELSSLGQIQVIVCGPPTASKFPGKPPYLFLTVNGVERPYTIENQACGDALAPLVGQLVTCSFQGSRESATVQVVETQPAPQNAAQPQGQGSQPYQQQAPAQAPAQTQHYAPTGGFEQASPAAPAPAQARPAAPAGINPDETLQKIANLLIRSLQGAEYVTNWWEHHTGEPLAADSFRALTSSIFITAKDRGLVDQMPAGALPSTK